MKERSGGARRRNRSAARSVQPFGGVLGSMRRAAIATLCFVLPALITIVYLARRWNAAARPATKPRLFTVHRGDLAVKVAETGTVEPLTKVEVKSKVGGKVLRLLAN